MKVHAAVPRLVLIAAALLALAACVGDDAEPVPDKAEGQPIPAGVARPLLSGEFGIELSAAPIARLGEDYKTSISVGGGTAPYRFQITAGDIPPGLTFDRETGIFWGTPSQLGRFELTVQIFDARGKSVSGPFALTVIEPDTPAEAGPSSAEHQAAGRSTTMGVLRDSVTASSTAALGGANRVDAPLPGLTGLLSPIPEGGWVAANLNRFMDVWTPEAQRNFDKNSGGVRSPAGIILAWSGFAWDPNRGDLILYGGGHANYGGNEVYRWHGTTRMWERASLPSEITQDALNNYRAIDGPDNAPVAAHTYDNSVFLPILDRFLTFGGAAYNNGDAYLRENGAGGSRYTGPYLWDPSKGDPNRVGGTTGSHVKREAPYPDVVGGQMWQNRDIPLNLASTPSLPSSHVSGCTGYAQEGGKDVVYVAARTGGGVGNHLFRYVVSNINTPSTDTWTKVGSYWDAPQSETVCAFDPVQKVLVHLGNKARPFLYWNLNTPSASGNYDTALSFTEVSGDLMTRLNAGLDLRNCGFDLDPVRRNYVLWCGGTDVWTLKPPATVGTTGWILQKQTVPAGSAPSTALGTGILGKWKYIPNLDAFMGLQDGNSGNVWIYKPYGWQPPGGGTVNVPPSVSLTAPVGGQTFALGASVTLQATASDSDGGVSKVEFFDGATNIGTVGQAPWQISWNGLAAGQHSITAVATDNLGASAASASATIQVNPGGAGTLTAVLQEGLNSYSGTRDTYLYSYWPTYNLGTLAMMVEQSGYAIPLVRFSIFNREGGPVPDNAVVTSAKLSLYKTSYYTTTFSANRLLCDWQETEVTWRLCRAGMAWTAAGAAGADADFVSVADGTGSVGFNPGTWLEIDVTSGLTAMQTGVPNYGWRISRSGGDNVNGKGFNTRNFTTDISLRPKLTVSYTVN